MMAVPSGYVYKDGAYWSNADGSGPYGVNSAGLAVPMWSGAQVLKTQPGDTSSNLLAETILTQIVIPPGALLLGGYLMVHWLIERTGGADTYTFRGRIGTLGTIGDATIFTPTSMGASAVASIAYTMPIVRKDSTTVQKLHPGTSSNVSAWAASSTGSVRIPNTIGNMDLATNYLSFSVAWTTGGVDTLTLGQLMAYIINP
jgi:hypothetical protein